MPRASFRKSLSGTENLRAELAKYRAALPGGSERVPSQKLGTTFRRCARAALSLAALWVLDQ